MKTYLTFLIALIFSADLILAQVPGYVPSTNLEAWWSFNGNANDLSGNGNNFANSGATLTSDRNSNSNSAFQFNGTSEYMIVNAPSFSFAQTGSFSVSFWMFKSSQNYGVALMNGASTTGNFIWNFQSSAGGVLNFGTNKQSFAWTWANASYPTNQWAHYVGTFSNGTMNIYENGSLVQTSTFPHTGSVQAVMPLNIGRGVGGNYFNGKLDDIGIWSRVLTQNEITTLYTSGCNVSVTSDPVNKSTIIGSTVKFGCAGNVQGLNYQWESDSSGSFKDLNNNVLYQGVSTDTLTISGAVMDLDNVKYRCTVSDTANCIATSKSAVLRVCGFITTQPSDQIVLINTNKEARFSVECNIPNAFYLWQVDSAGTFYNLVNNNIYSGVQTDTLTISPITLNLNGKKYRCIVFSSLCKDTSNMVLLTVNVVIDGIDEVVTKGMLIFPNPAGETINLKVKENYLNSEFRIVNSFGQTVLKGKIHSAETRIDISGFANGNYFLIISDHSYDAFTVNK
jgi:hypothetical protein